MPGSKILLKSQISILNSHASEYEHSTASAAARGQLSIFDMLEHQAIAKAHLLSYHQRHSRGHEPEP